MILLETAALGLPPPDANAAAPPAGTVTKYIDFSSDTIIDAAPSSAYYPFATYSKPLDLGSGNIQSVTVKVNGVGVPVTPSGGKIMVNAIGQRRTVYGWSKSIPGHHIFKVTDPDHPSQTGLWAHKGSDPNSFSSVIPDFTAYLDACGFPSSNVKCGDNIMIDTVQAAPGTLPLSGIDTSTGISFGSGKYPINLRYTYGRDPNDKFPNWGMEGAAVTASYDAPAPVSMCSIKPAYGQACNVAGGVDISNAKVEQASFAVTSDSRADAQNDGSNGEAAAQVFYWGQGPEGQGQVYVRRMLTDTVAGMNTFAQIGADRNYYMAANLAWEAKTYEYVGIVTITYAATVKPDLGGLALVNSCVGIGKPTTYTFNYKNNGLDLTTAFKISIRADGVEISSINVTTARYSGLGYQGTFNYTMNSSKTLSISLDDGHAVDESDESNNVLNVPITPQASCSGGGSEPEVITGTISVDYPSVKYGEAEFIWLRDVAVSGGASCVLAKGDLIYSQNGTQKIYHLNSIGTWNQTFVASPYNGIGVGTITVQYDITTSCGTKKTIGPTSFEVTANAGNGDPEFKPGWFDEDYYSGGYSDPITEVPLGERVSLGHVTKPRIPELGEDGTPYDPDGDSIIYFWNFSGSSSEWIRWIGDTKDGLGYDPNGESFSNLKVPDTVGTHTVQVTAFDGKGGSAGPYNATLRVVEPNPVPIITLPPKVVEGRAYTPAISCTNSYSPYKYRTISSCDWLGTNLPVYSTYGPKDIQLSVTDSTGLASSYFAHETLNVEEDLPPVARLDYNDIGIRNVPISFQDKSFSPDGDPISEHTVSLSCDMNNNGSLTDETVTNITPDGGGNLTYTPTQVAKKCNVHIHLKEGLGLKKSTDKDFPFEVVNQMPEVDFSAIGVQPEPANITTVTPTANTLVNSSVWTASSLTKVSAPKLYNYSSAYNSVSTRNMTNYAPYKSITGSNVVTKWFSTTKSYCGECGNTGKLDGYYASFAKESRFGKHLWKSEQNNDAVYFYNEDNPAILYGSGVGSAPTFSNNGGWGEEVIPKLIYSPSNMTEFESDMVFQRVGGYNSYWQNSIYNEYITRISDILNFIKNPNNQTVAPVYTGTKTITCGSAWSDSPTCPPPEPTTYPSMFTGPNPKVTDGVLMDSVNYGYDWDGYVVQRGTTQFSSPFNRDSSGNVYKNKCDYGYYDNYPHSCSLVKYTSGGVVMWEYTPTPTSWIYSNRTSILVEYLSDNESKIVISYGGQRLVLDANTGSVLLNLVTDRTATNNLKYSLGVFNNRIAYINQTSSAGLSYWDLYFYDLGTGQTITVDRTKTFIPSEETTPGSGDYKIRVPVPKAVLSSDGKIILGNGETNVLVYDMFSGAKEVDIPTGLALYNYYSGGTQTSGIKSINLTEDGTVKVVYYGYLDYSSDQSRREWILSIKTDVNNSAGNSTYGFLSNNDKGFFNGDVSLKVKFNLNTYSDSVTSGIGFRAQDNKNMYRVEATPNLIKLSKIVNGVSTTITSKTYNFKLGVYVEIKAKVRGNHLIVYAARVPIIDVYDNAFLVAGGYGLYSEAPYVELQGFNAMNYESSDTAVANQAIVNMPITYSTNYLDPENDPAIPNLATWKFTNMEPYKFLNAGDGASDPIGTNSYNGVVIQTPSPSISKVGVFKVEFQELDDPAPAGFKYPSPVFAMFQKMSDPATHSILVHRRPIEQFTIAEIPDHTIQWTETGFDPDRWLSASNYSTEATGKNYQSTRGIFNNRYSYTTPSGVTQLGKLTRPTEIGLYTVRAAVADEFGAWSDWVEQSINITIPLPNQPPAAVLTFPNGTQSNPSYVNTLQPTNTWNQTDPDVGTTFAAFQIVIKDELGNVFVDSGIKPQGTSANTQEWITSQALAQGQKYQVQVRVSDGIAWSPWSNVGWLITNRPPIATMLDPNGTQATPTIFSSMRPTLKWTQTDPDPGTTFSYFQIQVTNEANNVMILDSGQYYQGSTFSTGSWTVNADLPAGQKLRVRARTYDGFVWSDWSQQTWMIINRSPVANFDWTPKPAYEGDQINLTNMSTDPDGDTLTYSWSIVDPNGVTTTNTTENTSIYSLNKQGVWKITLTVTDPFGASSAVTKNVSVGVLSILGKIFHSSIWEINRKNYNMVVSGSQNSPWPTNMFLAGEVFMLAATTTTIDPLSNVRATSVDVTLNTTGDTVNLTSTNGTTWTGQLWNLGYKDLDKYATHSFTFHVRHSNGVDKYNTQTISIYDAKTVDDYWLLKRDK
ncbi:PKD domain-containing protein [Paenibacillus sp. LjRoot153]|uniref:glycoside hydrolase family 78 protein n=1 Tax=Paenibacillus sp. LjRoot153 TaxID=3342270 RepID=UPI003ECD2863